MWAFWLALVLIGLAAIVVLGLFAAPKDEDDDDMRGTTNPGAFGLRPLDDDDTRHH